LRSLAASTTRRRVGSTSENENLAFIAAEVRKRATAVQTNNQDWKSPSLATLTDNSSDASLSDDEESLNSVANQSRIIADEPLALLSSLQATQRKSVKHSALATWRNFRKKRQRDELSSQLEKLAAQLQHQMTRVTQLQTNLSNNNILSSPDSLADPKPFLTSKVSSLQQRRIRPFFAVFRRKRRPSGPASKPAVSIQRHPSNFS